MANYEQYQQRGFPDGDKSQRHQADLMAQTQPRSADLEEFANPEAIYEVMFPTDEATDLKDLMRIRALKRALPMGKILKRVSYGEKAGHAFAVSEGKGKQTVAGSPEGKAALQSLGGFLMDLGPLKNSIVQPADGEGLEYLAQQVLEARISGESISLYTPFCPDWSRDEQGRYDFKSLSGGMSYIAEKFLRESPPLLAAYRRHDIPYAGTLILANWGLENDLTARDERGRPLNPEQVQERFMATAGRVQDQIALLQEHEATADIFAGYTVVPMTDFFAQQGIEPTEAFNQSVTFFQEAKGGRKLVEELATASYPINRDRLGLDQETNRRQTVQNLAEYATLGLAFGQEGVIIVAESATASKAYNAPRQRKLPLFYVKGSEGINEGVNIL